jgi:CelD/BcsL family acetyltransferase involved in cellulose biosynthesis
VHHSSLFETKTRLVAADFTAEHNKRSHMMESTRGTFEINPLQDPRWKAFIAKRSDASVFHRVEWLRALNSCYGYEPCVLSLTPPSEPLSNGIVFCQVRSRLTGRRIVSIPFTDHCDPLVNDSEEFHQLLRALAEKVDRERLKYLEIRPINFAPDCAEPFAISNRYFLHRLDLQPSEQVLFRGFHKDCVQRKIRRAEREVLRYEEGSSDLLLSQFYQLLIMTRRRQGVPPQPLKWYRNLISCMGSDLKIRVASKGETPVASVLTISDKKKMVYKYGCSDARFNNLGGTLLLFWRTIQEAKAKGLEEFDLGRSDVNNVGLATFKEHWGARRLEVNYWRYPARATSVGPEYAIKHMPRLISIMPDMPLVMLGRLLYPHIG